MRRFVSSFITASLLLGPPNLLAKPTQEVKVNSSQTNLSERPSVCEQVRITLNSGRKIDADSYKHQEDHVEITKKGAFQTILEKDIKRIDVRQGSCPDIVLMLKTGEKVVGYRRDHTCRDRHQCKTEISQQGKVRTIADSDIKTVGLKFKKTFGEKLKNAALVPLHGFSYLILLILCSTGGCDDL